MKSRQDFASDDEYYEYLLVYISIQAMQGILFQNMMFSETDELYDRNKPKDVTDRSISYAKELINKIKKETNK